jgi:hypothetical protein
LPVIVAAMARAGDPFETETFDALRAEQRLLLRGIVDWLVGDAIDVWSPHVTSELGPDAPMVEGALRAEAERLRDTIEDSAPGFLDAMAASTRAAAVQRFFAAAPVTRKETAMNAPRDVLTDLQARASDESALEVHDVGTVMTQVFDLIVALVLADQLAGDYRDPRLPAG